MKAYNDPSDYHTFTPTAADYERAEGHVFRVVIRHYKCDECGHEFNGPENVDCPVCACKVEGGKPLSTIVIYANTGETEVFDGRFHP